MSKVMETKRPLGKKIGPRPVMKTGKAQLVKNKKAFKLEAEQLQKHLEADKKNLTAKYAVGKLPSSKENKPKRK